MTYTNQPYDNLPIKQAAALRKGAKIRCAKAIQGLMHSIQNMIPESFTPNEIDQIERVVANVVDRAEKVFQTEIRKADTTTSASEVSNWSAPEQRSYNGK